jgi:hypothetical protein
MLCDIKALQDDNRLTRFWSFVKDPSKIVDMRKQYDDALGLFHVRTYPIELDDSVLNHKIAGCRDNHGYRSRKCTEES